MNASQDEPSKTPQHESPPQLDETLAFSDETSGSPPGAAEEIGEASLWIGKQIDRYEITRLLGAGGMGMVFDAHDTKIERHVALKILPRELVEDEVARRRFLDEARAAGKLSHPHTVVLYEIGEQEGIHYIVMELVAGGSAADFLEQQTAYSPQQATRIVREAAAGLAAAHAAGIVHRDVKPANLLLTGNGSVKVSDFGLAKQLSDTTLGMTREGQLIGTPSFMSPEQCEAATVDFRTDIYSLGASYYALLTGARPFQDQKSVVSVMYAHCHASPPDVRDLNPQIPEACAKVIQRAMAKRPQDRYRSMEAMEADLRAIEDGRGGEVAVATAGQRASWRGRRGLLLGGLVLAGLCGLGWLAVEKRWGNNADNMAVVPPAGEPIRVGVLHSISGTMADSERPVVDATLLAIEQLNEAGGVLGRPVEPILADGKSQADSFLAETDRLINQDKVCTIFGCWKSSARKTIVPLLEETNHLLIYPVQYEGLEESPNVIYLGATPNQQILPAIDWLFHDLKVQTFFLVGSDYVFPRMAAEIIKDRISELGGKVVDEVYLPLGSRHVDAAVAAIKKSSPDVVLNLINGSTNIPFFNELREQGITPKDIPTLSFSISEATSSRMDPAKIAGDYAAYNYFQSLPSAENKIFVQQFKKKYGPLRVVTDPMETAYAGVKFWAAAVEEAGSTDPAAIRRALRGMRGDTPGGPLRIDPATQHAFKRPRIGQIRTDGQFDIVWESKELVSPEPYPHSRTAAAWRAVLNDLYRGWGNRWAAPESSGRAQADGAASVPSDTSNE